MHRMVVVQPRETAHDERDEQVERDPQEHRERRRRQTIELAQGEETPEAGEEDPGGDGAKAAEVEDGEWRISVVEMEIVVHRISTDLVIASEPDERSDTLQQHADAPQHCEEEKDGSERGHDETSEFPRHAAR